MRTVLTSIEQEYRRYKTLAEAATAQLVDDQLHEPAAGDGNTVAALMAHLGGNLASRFTDFLTTDGEKPWREREEEFARAALAREEIIRRWDRGWNALFETLRELDDGDMHRTVTIRGTPLLVAAALQRSLAHTAYHVGQIVLLARGHKGEEWTYLSIPPRESESYNASPTLEKALDHVERLKEEREGG